MCALKWKKKYVKNVYLKKLRFHNLLVIINQFYYESDYFALAFKITNPKKTCLKNKIILINANKGKFYILEALSNQFPLYKEVFSVKINSFMSINKFLTQVDQHFSLPKFEIYNSCKEQILDFLNKVLIKKTIYKLQQELQEINFCEKELIADYSFYKNSVVEIKIPSTATINFEVKTEGEENKEQILLFVVRNSKNKELLKLNFNHKLNFDKFVEQFNKVHFFDKEKAQKKYLELEAKRINSLNNLIANIKSKI